MNTVTLVGRVATDIELTAPKGNPIATFRLAVAGATREQDADFFSVKAFGAPAESHARYLAKGRQVAIVGRLSQNTWTTEAGDNRERVEVIANRVEYLDGPTSADTSQTDVPDKGEEAF